MPEDQTPVRLCEDAFPWTGQEHLANGDTVCAVEPVDGTPTLTEQYGRGAPVMREMAVARCSWRLKTQK